MMPSARIFSICIVLFLTSALISTTIRAGRYSQTWPSFIRKVKHQPAKEIPNVAFATFLSGDPNANETSKHNGKSEDEDTADGYYLGARVLTYQLLHNPTTRTKDSIPFVVLVTSDVSRSKRDRLSRDGATVLVTEKLDAAWVKPGSDRWRDVLAKLRLFQLTHYKKICFIDADMLVTGRLDGVFKDPATDLLRTKKETEAVRSDEAALPSTYMFAGKGDAWGYDHEIPPKPSDYLNSGFFVFTPSNELFEYYASLLRLPNRFDPQFPEQNLLNYAHRKDGNMPWATLSWRWNMNWPTMKDFKAGAKSFHAKYWDDDPTHDQELKRKWQAQRHEMIGYYRGVDDSTQRRN